MLMFVLSASMPTFWLTVFSFTSSLRVWPH